MDAPPDPSLPPDGACLHHLAAALARMRDSLVDLSLTLQDYQFEQDAQQRADAATLTQGLLDALSRPRD